MHDAVTKADVKALKVWLHGLTFGKQYTHGEDGRGIQ